MCQKCHFSFQNPFPLPFPISCSHNNRNEHPLGCFAQHSTWNMCPMTLVLLFFYMEFWPGWWALVLHQECCNSQGLAYFNLSTRGSYKLGVDSAIYTTYAFYSCHPLLLYEIVLFLGFLGEIYHTSMKLN